MTVSEIIWVTQHYILIQAQEKIDSVQGGDTKPDMSFSSPRSSVTSASIDKIRTSANSSSTKGKDLE